MKIALAGTGYLGLSQRNEVVALDIIQEKVDMINNKQAPIEDTKINNFLQNKELNLQATTDAQEAFRMLHSSLFQFQRTMIPQQIISIRVLSRLLLNKSYRLILIQQ